MEASRNSGARISARLRLAGDRVRPHIQGMPAHAVIGISKRSVRTPGRGISAANQTFSPAGTGNRESRDELANARLYRPSHQEPGGLDGLRRRFLGMQLVDKSRGTARSAWTTRSSASWSTRTPARRRASSAGRSPTPPRSTPTPRSWKATRCRSRAARRALAEERKVRDLIVLHDPAGNRLEVFHGAEIATDPFKPGRAISGFRTGPLGMGHAVLHCERIDDVLPFYQRHPGLPAERLLHRPFKAYFFHVNPRHHSVAFIETGKNGIHHLMVEPAISTTSDRPTTSRCRRPGDDRDDVRPPLQRP